nr:hypothetical protein [Actinotalea sp. C106]
MVSDSAGEFFEREVFDQQVPQIPACQSRGSLTDTSVLDNGGGFVAPEELCESQWINGRVATGGAHVLQGGVAARLARDDDTPPLRYMRREGLRPSLLDHDRDVVQAPLVDLALSRESSKPVAGGLDLEAAQRAVDHPDIDPRLSEAEGQLRPHPRVRIVRVIGCELLQERVPDLPVAHAGSLGTVGRFA